jgi:hypothetical protein
MQKIRFIKAGSTRVDLNLSVSCFCCSMTNTSPLEYKLEERVGAIIPDFVDPSL